MQTEDITLSSDGLGIAARVVWPDRLEPAPGLILCHGFGSCKENHAAFAALAATEGWAVLSFDFRGHGASDGCLDSRTINDVGAALRWMAAHPRVDAARLAIRGSSLGGYFALHAAAKWAEVGCCVALNPPDEAGLSRVLHDARDPATFFGAWRARGEAFPRVMGCDLACWLESSDVYEAAGRIAPRPLLLIHSIADEVVPVGSSEGLFAAAGEPKRFWRLESGDHRFAAHDPEVGARTLDWLRDPR